MKSCMLFFVPLASILIDPSPRNQNLSMLARLINWCLENPRLFWAIVIVGLVGDASFFFWYLK